MYTVGIDIGSTACKAVILKNGKNIVGTSAIQTGTGTSGPKRVYAEVFANANLTPSDVTRVIVTGYGRLTFKQADKQISELSCHAKGARFLYPTARTVIDIGGQDAKALRLSPDGTLLGFVMNDKCAAGTGRFLDVMAKVMEVGTDELAALSEKSTVKLSISNICTVFAESEVISQLASGKKKQDIAAGIHHSVANRVAGLARRTGITEDVVMTGGVAQNGGVVLAMSEILEIPVTPVPMPQLAGALGAAIFAYEEALETA